VLFLGTLEDAKSIITEVFGPNTAMKLDDFAKEYPPDKQGKEFLDKCKGLMSRFINHKTTDEKFAPLYEQVN
jgi:hypothetical protein